MPRVRIHKHPYVHFVFITTLLMYTSYSLQHCLPFRSLVTVHFYKSFVLTSSRVQCAHSEYITHKVRSSITIVPTEVRTTHMYTNYNNAYIPTYLTDILLQEGWRMPWLHPIHEMDGAYIYSRVDNLKS